MRRFAAAVLVVAVPGLCAGSRTPAYSCCQATLPISPDIAGYLAIVSAYRKGPSAGAVAAIRAWDQGRIERTVRDIPGQLEARLRVCQDRPDVVTFTALDAAVMLHTDAALAGMQDANASDAALHVDQAQKILEWASRRRLQQGGAAQDAEAAKCNASAPISRRDWYLATTRMALRAWALQTATALSERLLRAASDDVEALFAAGTVQEGLAINDAQYYLPPPGWRLSDSDWLRAQDRYQRSVRERKTCREAALGHYARASRIAPARQDIRLRLGWVLFLLDRRDEARAALEQAHERAEAPSVRYLAALFLGRVDETSSRLDDAVTWYLRACAIDPDGHVARLALSHALGQEGLIDESRADILRALGPPGPSGDEDPWSEYPVGNWRAGKALLDQLREHVTERPGGAR
jgi:tetratricopeptide (TPR) repeat protein